MNNRGLVLRALGRVGLPPCETRRCQHYGRCRDEHLACKGFHFWVAKAPASSWRSFPEDKLFVPTTLMYDYVFGNDTYPDIPDTEDS